MCTCLVFHHFTAQSLTLSLYFSCSSRFFDEEFCDADERVAPISPASEVKLGSQAWEVEEDPDYVENEDMASECAYQH